MNLADSRNMSHEQRILAGVDQMAGEDLLGEATTRLIARFSNLSEETILRHMPDRQAILDRWLESRGDRLRAILGKSPPGRQGLMATIRELLASPALLGLLFCHHGESHTFREALEPLRQETQALFLDRIGEMPTRPRMQNPADLLETIWQALEIAWNRRHPDHRQQRKALLDHLPWEGRETGDGPGELFPKAEDVRRLAISESGFVFNPLSGHSFTCNETGLFLLRLMGKETSLETLVREVVAVYDTGPSEAEKEILAFVAHVRETLK